MPVRKILLLAGLWMLFAGKGLAQNGCGNRGQTPGGAFPLCGTAPFTQTTVPACPGKRIPVPGCANSSATYADINPYWYKFTCYTTGTLAFTITPNNLADDYDWQLFDITGHNAADVYTDASLFVSGNWSGSSGLTGASDNGTGNIQCASSPAQNIPTFSTMPNLVAGHEYLLMISHFTADNQSGYSIAFTGGTAGTAGTASITDPSLPRLNSATVQSCDGTRIAVRLDRTLTCASLAADGSDFLITPGNIKVTAANAVSCTNGFDMDSILLTLDKTPPPGNYQVVMQKGSDGNTLLNTCHVPLPEGSQTGFTVLPLSPTPMDSLSPVGCRADSLQLVFRKGIRCASVAADGSDFRLTGGDGTTGITGVKTYCNTDNATTTVTLLLNRPLYTQNNYQLVLQTGNDGNTLVDVCGQETPAGSVVRFSSADTVSAAFTYRLASSCGSDTIRFFHNGNNGVNQWNWRFDQAAASAIQNPVYIYRSGGTKKIQLTVTNGTCTDSSGQNIVLDDGIKARFTGPENVCPQDAAVFTDSSTGRVTGWNWNFGNGNTSNLQSPPSQQYITTARSQVIQVSLAVRNNLGCTDTLRRAITVYNSCYIDVPTAFTPNNDGLNDYLYPLSGFRALHLLFRVYNRYGQLVFETRDWTRKWDGRISGALQPPGTYVWTLSYTTMDTGQQIFQKGTTVLIR